MIRGAPGIRRRAGLPMAAKSNLAKSASMDADTVSLTDVVRQRLEDMILKGAIPAGERLNENALASEMKVSRGPVREAVRSLEQAGLVEIVRNRGVFVRKVSLAETLHLYDVRSGLARIAGRLLALRASSAQIDELTALWEDMEQARRAQDTDGFHEINLTFHGQLVAFAGNPRLMAVDEGIGKELRLFLWRGLFGASRLRVSNLQHREILDAVIEGDEEKAGSAFERHVIMGKQRMLDNVIGNANR